MSESQAADLTATAAAAGKPEVTRLHVNLSLENTCRISIPGPISDVGVIMSFE